MFCIKLIVMERSLALRTFPFMYLCCLPEDGQVKRPKRVVDK